MKYLPMMFGAFAVMTFAASGRADPPGTYTTRVVEIIGRQMRPSVAVEVNKVAPRLAIVELQRAVTDRIGEAAQRDPF
jgi:hypothetical protein